MTQPSPQSENGVASLEERLNEPDTAEALHRILDRLDAIEEAVDSISMAARQGPAAAAMVTDMADDAYRTAEEAGVDLDERLQLALQLVERLTAPRTVDVLSRLTERMDEVDQLLDLADQAPGFIAMLTDMVDDAYRMAEETGHDPERVLRNSLQGLVQASEFVEAGGFDALKESGVLDPESVAMVGKAADALVDCQKECDGAPPEVGFFGALRALRDPDTRRALGFLTMFGKHFGRKLD